MNYEGSKMNYEAEINMLKSRADNHQSLLDGLRIDANWLGGMATSAAADIDNLEIAEAQDQSGDNYAMNLINQLQSQVQYLMNEVNALKAH